MATPPKVRAFLLCDAAITDRASGKTTLVGILDQFVATSYPALCTTFTVYFKLTDLNGSYAFEVLFFAPDLATVIAKVSFPRRVAEHDPLLPVEGSAVMSGLRLPVPGRYAVRLVYNGLVADEFSIGATQPP